MTTDKQTVPKWFKGMIYSEGETVTNPFSDQSYNLTGLELSVYDFIMGTNFLMENSPMSLDDGQISDFKKAMTWFRKNSPEAYMVLLD